MSTTLAEQFLLGQITEIGKQYTAEHEVEIRVCSHHGNCPCAGRIAPVVLDYYIFADDSVYVDALGMERVFSDDADMWDWIIGSDDLGEAVAARW